MSREILFKAKRKSDGVWFEGMLTKTTVETPSETEVIYKIDEHNCGYSDESTFEPTYISGFCEEVDEKTICQFTGLRDKNGNRIWENDIVKTKFGRLCKVVWRQTQCFVGWDFDVCDFDFGVNDFSKPPSSWDLYFSENLEVIGNSIDNHELLTAEDVFERMKKHYEKTEKGGAENG